MYFNNWITWIPQFGTDINIFELLKKTLDSLSAIKEAEMGVKGVVCTT